MADQPKTPARPIVGPLSKPAMPRYIKLRNDETRGRWVILAPERVFNPDDNAVAVLQLCDGARSVTDIAEALGKEYNAPVDEILGDIVAMLQELADKGVVRV